MCSFIEFLMVFAFILIIIEFLISSGGIFAFSGITAFILSMVLLFIMDITIPRIVLDVAIPSFIILASLSLISVYLAYKAQKRKPIIDGKQIIGKTAVCTKPITPQTEGQIEVDGEIWTATAEEAIDKGEKVVIIDQDSLKVRVGKLTDQQNP
ncbi:NfeD family protein [Hippea sp. KM1]|uniref:NfeD family protein n=1 Tax=Hippea sp. KM1 TaxID=944481 RepID=UPI00046D908F|nr:NfeD family protein [Hippea sp. KM1]